MYATSSVHTGWSSVGSDGKIKFVDDQIGGHAFVIVAYDADGLWIQNSWGATGGYQGFGQVSYDDWLKNGTDIWVALSGAPIKLLTAVAAATGYAASSKGSRSYVFCDLRPHIISIGNDGQLRTDGTYGTSATDVQAIVTGDFPDSRPSGRKRLLLYAHGGLVPRFCCPTCRRLSGGVIGRRGLSACLHLEDRLLVYLEGRTERLPSPPPPRGNSRQEQRLYARPSGRCPGAHCPHLQRQA